MRFGKKLVSIASTVLMTTGVALVATAPAAHAYTPPATLDPTNWSVACDSLTGSIKFATAISLAPSTTDNTISVKAVTQGCVVPAATGVATVGGGLVNSGAGNADGDPSSCVAPGVKHGSLTGNGTTTTSSMNIVSGTALFLASDVGQFITGVGIPGDTTVTAVADSTHATISQNATATSSVVKFTLGLGTPNSPCVNLAPAKLGGTLTALAGHNNFHNTASDGHITNGSPNISCATCSFNALEVGASITAAGIPANTTLASITNANQAVMSANATATSTTTHFAHADSSGCLGLQGLSTGTGGNNITVFKNGSAGLDGAKLPKLLTADSGNTTANVTSTVNSTYGNTFNAPWGASYGDFQIGTSFGTNPASRNAGAFRGSAGANDLFEGTTGESSGAILIQCLGKGVKALTFGLGHLAFD